MFTNKINNLSHSIELRQIDTNLNYSSKAKGSKIVHKSLSGSKTSTAEIKNSIQDNAYHTIADKSNSAERHPERGMRQTYGAK